MIVAVVSGILALAWTRVSSRAARWVLGLGDPLIVALAFYWYPVWAEGFDASEQAAWAPLFIVPWYVAGVAASAAVLCLFGPRRPQREKHG